MIFSRSQTLIGWSWLNIHVWLSLSGRPKMAPSKGKNTRISEGFLQVVGYVCDKGWMLTSAPLFFVYRWGCAKETAGESQERGEWKISFRFAGWRWSRVDQKLMFSFGFLRLCLWIFSLLFLFVRQAARKVMRFCFPDDDNLNFSELSAVPFNARHLSFGIQVKQLMEEAVTKKFIHADSSSITSLCGKNYFTYI